MNSATVAAVDPATPVKSSDSSSLYPSTTSVLACDSSRTSWAPPFWWIATPTTTRANDPARRSSSRTITSMYPYPWPLSLCRLMLIVPSGERLSELTTYTGRPYGASAE